MTRSFAALAGLLLCSCAEPAPDIAVAGAWARATAPGQSSAAVYLTIANRGGADRLVALSTPVAGSAELHGSSSQGGIARMRPLRGGLDIPARGNAVLRPGGDHVMLTGLKGSLEPGRRFELRLDFERSGRRTVPVAIADAAAPGPAGHEGH